MVRTRNAVALAALALLLAAPAARAEDARSFPWTGVRLGGAWGFNSASGGTPSAGGGGGYVMFDANEYLADFSLDLFFGDSAHLVDAGLGAYYPFSHGNVAPYAGGGIKVGWTKFGGDGTFGMIPYAALGVVFGRTAFPQLRLELAYFLATSRERAAGQTGDGARANGPMLTLGLGF
ncbi:MAG: hypothetical protein ACJ79R_16795 [Anaeromyxobacteraceae bacterium]